MSYEFLFLLSSRVYIILEFIIHHVIVFYILELRCLLSAPYFFNIRFLLYGRSIAVLADSVRPKST